MDLIAKAVTLKSIKLNDPEAKKLLFSAKHSVLYLFDSRTSSWVPETPIWHVACTNYIPLLVGKDGN